MADRILEEIQQWERQYVEPDIAPVVMNAWQNVGHAKSLFAVIGARATGKTSFLNYLAACIPQDQVVHLKLNAMPNEESVGLHFLQTLNWDPEKVQTTKTKGDWVSYLDVAFNLIADREKPTLILFDDLDHFVSRRGQFESYIRSKLLDSTNFLFIATVTRGSEERLFDYAKPFYGLFEILELDRLPDRKVQSMLTDLGLDESTAKILTDCIDGEPILLKAIGNTLALLGSEASQKSLVTVLTATAITMLPFFEAIQRDVPPAAQSILPLLSKEGNRWLTSTEIASQINADSKAISTFLRRLADANIVEKNGKYFSLRPLYDFGYWWISNDNKLGKTIDEIVESYRNRRKVLPRGKTA